MNHKIFTDGREFYVFKGLLALPVLFVFLLAAASRRRNYQTPGKRKQSSGGFLPVSDRTECPAFKIEKEQEN